jgi:polysaccharide deacetylase family protein (PEP-CTERM system associated)
MKNALTIDLENWYDANLIAPYVSSGYRDNRVVASTNRILDLLDKYEVKATFFTLGSLAEEQPELILEIDRRGHEVASHGWGHQLVYSQTEEKFEDDLVRGIGAIKSVTGKLACGFRAPSWSVGEGTPWFYDVLIRNGIEYDSSLFPVKTELFGSADNPRRPHIVRRDSGNLIEFPASTVRVAGRNYPVAGGAFFRVFPFWYSRWGIGRINREGLPAIIYLHPWELDTGIPFPSMPKKVRLMHSMGRSGMIGKLKRLLKIFEFQPMGKMAGKYIRS